MNKRIATRLHVSSALVAAFALVGTGCAAMERMATLAIMASAQQGGAWGYNPNTFVGGSYYQGGYYGGVNIQAGYYNQGAPIFQQPLVMGPNGQVVVQQGYGQQQVVYAQQQFQGGGMRVGGVQPGFNGMPVNTAAGVVMRQNSTGLQTFSRSVCDQDPGGCDVYMTGTAGPTLPNGQQTTIGVTTLPGGYVVPNLAPR